MARIRPAESRDVASIQFVARESWADAYEELIPRDVQARALEAWYSSESLLRAIDDGRSIFLVAEDGDSVIGFIHCFDAELARIYVLPHAQRRGVGTQLFDAARTRVRATSIRVTVEAQNEKGRRFYERSGFVPRSRGTQTIFGYEVPVIAYELTLDPPPPARPSSPSARR